VPDERWGEIVCLAVCVADGSAPELDAVRLVLHQRLAKHKHPRRVVPVAMIPRTAATGQVQRRVLSETVSRRIDAHG